VIDRADFSGGQDSQFYKEGEYTALPMSISDKFQRAIAGSMPNIVAILEDDELPRNFEARASRLNGLACALQWISVGFDWDKRALVIFKLSTGGMGFKM
jgi:hypothetical protein